MGINLLISGADVVLGLFFTALVTRQYAERRKRHQLMWAIAIAMWTIAVAAEFAATLSGWTELTYRAYYATGALLIPAWLGMGTLYLVMPTRKQLADRILGALVVLSILGIILISVWTINPAQLSSAGADFVPLRVFPFFPIQILLIILNTFGALAFILGALSSALHFMRMQAMGERALATALIALGGIIAAVAHSLGVLSGIELFRVSELVALIFIFIGFILSSPAPRRAATPEARAAS
ncbi:MAG: hypothetical protein HY782_11175 [Chloroflexi bacterium]|nr:hypothetical protein [Chloroflexota bacterium]